VAARGGGRIDGAARGAGMIDVAARGAGGVDGAAHGAEEVVSGCVVADEEQVTTQDGAPGVGKE
jgi:hypothetical protein